ncbi:thiF protein [Flavobacterium enshiense DK69]|uniref:Molybdopterin-synthase adenylyltransferase n=1 Tax=Flavobacterium enshiense DK69 TaxID=1107311 RepID=V6S8X7_9FLAO|nr:HesA/MoeB/ThiF family protein [Flavobacterium enshiense]ESU23133.1 thiF protein [Flavobacterium enshiense DK69]KGO96005.1 thiamine biosynthesis protein ThiF [Flavobacterium enshiense DK69]
MITIHDYLRYGKPMLLTEVGEAGQLKLKNAKVLVIGAGGLGCPVLQYLAASGVGSIGLVDFDKVELHNLHRQILYTEINIDNSKAIAAKTVLETLNPHIEVRAFKEKLTAQNAEHILKDFDVIVDGCDNFSTRYLVNDTCVRLGKALVYGSILKFEGQIAVFNNKGSKNLRDLFPQPPNPEDVPNCSVNGVMGTLPGIIGTMMAHETLKLIMDLPTLENELVLFSTLNWNFTKLKF